MKNRRKIEGKTMAWTRAGTFCVLAVVNIAASPTAAGLLTLDAAMSWTPSPFLADIGPSAAKWHISPAQE